MMQWLAPRRPAQWQTLISLMGIRGAQAREGRGKYRKGLGEDPEMDMILDTFDRMRDVTERRALERRGNGRRRR